MSNLKDLLAQRANLDKQIHETQTRERQDAISKVRSLMSEYGLTTADLGTKAPKQAGTAKVAAKYRNTATGDAWSGRGLKPKWLQAELAAGRTLNDFAV